MTAALNAEGNLPRRFRSDLGAAGSQDSLNADWPGPFGVGHTWDKWAPVAQRERPMSLSLAHSEAIVRAHIRPRARRLTSSKKEQDQR